MTFGSLFSGIGGFDLGFERAGLTCSWQVEIDPFCRRVLAKHWPDVKRWDDVKTFPPSDPEEWRCDVICGGFPCQDISTAGRRAGLAGERSGLWSEMARVVALLRPHFVVVENTPGLLAPIRDDAGRVAEPAPVGRLLGEFSACGYDAEWQVLPACAFGAPHIRDRVFVLAYPAGHGDGLRLLPAGRGRAGQGAADAQGGSDGLAADTPGDRDRRRGHAPGGAAPPGLLAATQGPSPHPDRQGLAVRESEPCDPREEQSAALGDGRVAITGSGWWGSEPAVVRMVHGVPRRLVRPAIHGLGNAVVPQVAEWIGRRLMACDTGETDP